MTCQISANSEQRGKSLRNSHLGPACTEPFNPFSKLSWNKRNSVPLHLTWLRTPVWNPSRSTVTFFWCVCVSPQSTRTAWQLTNVPFAWCPSRSSCWERLMAAGMSSAWTVFRSGPRYAKAAGTKTTTHTFTGAIKTQTSTMGQLPQCVEYIYGIARNVYSTLMEPFPNTAHWQKKRKNQKNNIQCLLQSTYNHWQTLLEHLHSVG